MQGRQARLGQFGSNGSLFILCYNAPQMNFPIPYDDTFYIDQKDGSYTSASIVVPHILSALQPRSVADFGCGVGTWLRAFSEAGLEDVIGIDGEYVRNELLMIPREKFLRADLSRPINLERKFDLVMSLEVAEHLPAAVAATFVDSLTRHSSIVLFSAAVPSQDGTNHVNEQWPRYWNTLFGERGYRCFDSLRQAFWDDPRIDWWYRQNMLLFIAEDTLPRVAALMNSGVPGRTDPLNLVHPEMLKRVENRPMGIRELLNKIPQALRTTLLWHRTRKRSAMSGC